MPPAPTRSMTRSASCSGKFGSIGPLPQSRRRAESWIAPVGNSRDDARGQYRGRQARPTPTYWLKPLVAVLSQGGTVSTHSLNANRADATYTKLSLLRAL
jgi:hypothetical protein